MTTKLSLSLLAIAGLVASATVAGAQDQLNRQQIVSSLTEATAAVGRLDPVALEQAAQRAAGSGGEDAVSRVSEQLASYPQISVQINFDINSARILPKSYHAVGLIADALHTPYLMGQQFAVVGHTDASGPREYNFKLSKERAAAVAEALITTFNVPPGQLIAIGVGEEQLQDQANPRSPINRRVQFINIGE